MDISLRSLQTNYILHLISSSHVQYIYTSIHPITNLDLLMTIMLHSLYHEEDSLLNYAI
jgi:hypothetical protein